MGNYDKPFKTFDELLDVLVNEHGLEIHNRDNAKGILKFIPYYDLVNGYKEIWMEGEKFKQGTEFYDLFLFHLYDHDFQNALFPFSVTIEDYFKNVLAYALALSFGVDQKDYLKLDHYLPPLDYGWRASIRRDDILPKIKKAAESTMDNPTRYYRTHHNHIPPWILMKNITFSTATKLFQLMKREQREIVLDIMIPVDRSSQQRYTVLLYTLTLVRKCRNAIAHNLKFTSFSCARYMNRLDERSLRLLIPSALISAQELKALKYLDGVYGYIALSLSLIPDTVTKALMINQLRSTLLIDPSAEHLSTKADRVREKYYAGLHIPPDIESRLRKYQSELCL